MSKGETYFRVASSEKDFSEIYEIRQKVFVEEDGYPVDKISINKNDHNLIGYREGKPEGSVAVSIASAKDLFLGSIVGWGDKEIADIHKLAILHESRKSILSLGLMVLAYEYAKKRVKDILVFCLKKKDYHIRTCEKFGFKVIKEFEFLGQPAVIMHLNLSDAVFEQEKSLRRMNFIKKLLVR